jgi:hypothetical protein
MRRCFGWSALLIALFGPGISARGQYVYPGGYGGYGWGGWGGGASTVQGNMATGMGNFAAGAGAYNVETAEARAVNANTAMQWNNYMYAINQRNANDEIAILNKRQGKVNETAEATSRRLRDTPDARDIHDGDALNLVLTDLSNPSTYSQVVQKSKQPIDSQLVKSIPFRYAPRMILISLDDISARGVPEVLARGPAFESDRKAIRAIVAKGKQEAESENHVSAATLRSFRAAVKTAQDKVAVALPLGTRNRTEADNFLKALLGLSKMLEQPDVAQFLKGLNRYPTTTLGHLITFMHSFNLRFGPAKTPEQEATYEKLYPMLVALRNQAQTQIANPTTASDTLPDPKHATEFFSGMDYGHFQPQPDPHSGPVAPPPPPPQAK